ncbi:hypothetical protein FP2506_10806 [Fulvimarina pelagi HTCC2506]|uniref:Uncharacterized protein n=2 Tax=Fulvimarina pelagi TaxID=217511 RepID=Q0G4T5_9HYPH|nr:hypothetical protein FP2506_10806 [Fulvimarina pelagi HTCC2506]
MVRLAATIEKAFLESKAWREGRKAYFLHGEAATCPYASSDPLGYYWRAGLQLEKWKPTISGEAPASAA